MTLSLPPKTEQQIAMACLAKSMACQQKLSNLLHNGCLTIPARMYVEMQQLNRAAEEAVGDEAITSTM